MTTKDSHTIMTTSPDYFEINAKPRVVNRCHISISDEENKIKYKFIQEVESEVQKTPVITESHTEISKVGVPKSMMDPMTKRRVQFIQNFTAQPHVSAKMINSEFQISSNNNNANCYLGEWAFSGHHKYGNEKDKSLKDIPMGLLCAYKLLDHHRVDIDHHIKNYSEFVKDHSDYEHVKTQMNSSSLWTKHFNARDHLTNDDDLMDAYDPYNLYHLLTYIGFGFKNDNDHQNVAVKNFMSSMQPRMDEDVFIQILTDMIDFITSGMKIVYGNCNWNQNNQKNIIKILALDKLLKNLLVKMSGTPDNRVTFQDHVIFA